MTSKPSGRRFDFEDRRYTPKEHATEWRRRIRVALEELQEAINTPPPDTHTIEVEIPKDDPRYDHAALEEVWIFLDGPQVLVKT